MTGIAWCAALIRTSTGTKKVEKIFLIDPKVPEKVDVNQHMMLFTAASKGQKGPGFEPLLPPLFIGARPPSGWVCQTNSYGWISSLPDEKSRHSPIVEKFPHSQNLSRRQHITLPKQDHTERRNDCERYDG
jgi:hypothetical protein